MVRAANHIIIANQRQQVHRIQWMHRPVSVLQNCLNSVCTTRFANVPIPNWINSHVHLLPVFIHATKKKNIKKTAYVKISCTRIERHCGSVSAVKFCLNLENQCPVQASETNESTSACCKIVERTRMWPHYSAQNRAPSLTPCLTVDATNKNDLSFEKKHNIKITRLCNQHKHVQSFATDHKILLKIESCSTIYQLLFLELQTHSCVTQHLFGLHLTHDGYKNCEFKLPKLRVLIKNRRRCELRRELRWHADGLHPEETLHALLSGDGWRVMFFAECTANFSYAFFKRIDLVHHATIIVSILLPQPW